MARSSRHGRSQPSFQAEQSGVTVAPRRISQRSITPASGESVIGSVFSATASFFGDLQDQKSELDHQKELIKIKEDNEKLAREAMEVLHHPRRREEAFAALRSGDVSQMARFSTFSDAATRKAYIDTFQIEGAKLMADDDAADWRTNILPTLGTDADPEAAFEDFLKEKTEGAAPLFTTQYAATARAQNEAAIETWRVDRANQVAAESLRRNDAVIASDFSSPRNYTTEMVTDSVARAVNAARTPEQKTQAEARAISGMISAATKVGGDVALERVLQRPIEGRSGVSYWELYKDEIEVAREQAFQEELRFRSISEYQDFRAVQTGYTSGDLDAEAALDQMEQWKNEYGNVIVPSEAQTFELKVYNDMKLDAKLDLMRGAIRLNSGVLISEDNLKEKDSFGVTQGERLIEEEIEANPDSPGLALAQIITQQPALRSFVKPELSAQLMSREPTTVVQAYDTMMKPVIQQRGLDFATGMLTSEAGSKVSYIHARSRTFRGAANPVEDAVRAWEDRDRTRMPSAKEAYRTYSGVSATDVQGENDAYIQAYNELNPDFELPTDASWSQAALESLNEGRNLLSQDMTGIPYERDTFNQTLAGKMAFDVVPQNGEMVIVPYDRPRNTPVGRELAPTRPMREADATAAQEIGDTIIAPVLDEDFYGLTSTRDGTSNDYGYAVLVGPGQIATMERGETFATARNRGPGVARPGQLGRRMPKIPDTITTPEAWPRDGWEVPGTEGAFVVFPDSRSPDVGVMYYRGERGMTPVEQEISNRTLIEKKAADEVLRKAREAGEVSTRPQGPRLGPRPTRGTINRMNESMGGTPRGQYVLPPNIEEFDPSGAAQTAYKRVVDIHAKTGRITAPQASRMRSERVTDDDMIEKASGVVDRGLAEGNSGDAISDPASKQVVSQLKEFLIDVEGWDNNMFRDTADTIGVGFNLESETADLDLRAANIPFTASQLREGNIRLTNPQVERLLDVTARRWYATVRNWYKDVPLRPHQMVGLVSLAFNAPSTVNPNIATELPKALRSGDWDRVDQEIRFRSGQNKIEDKFVLGLARRRAKEANKVRGTTRGLRLSSIMPKRKPK